MTLKVASVPLAVAAGAIGVLSPCVWPLVPVVMSSAAMAGRRGPWFLAAGLSLSVALAGTLLGGLVVGTGIDPTALRRISALLLLGAAAILLVRSLGERVSLLLSRLSGRLGGAPTTDAASSLGQLGVRALLSLVWLPCVSPTLGAAVALAALGQDLWMVFLVMAAFGLGTALALLTAALLSARLLARLRPPIGAGAGLGKLALGSTLLLLGLAVLTGPDEAIETRAVAYLPSWAMGL